MVLNIQLKDLRLQIEAFSSQDSLTIDGVIGILLSSKR